MMADLDTQKLNAQKELDALAAIADDKERAEAINAKAMVISELTGVDLVAASNGLAKKVDAIIASQAKPPSNYVTNFMPENGQAVVSSGINRDGITGGNLSLQTPSVETKAGNFAGFASSGINAEGDVPAATLGAKYVTPAFKAGDFTGVGIGVASASIPLNGDELNAGNVGLTAGAAIWHNKTGISSITTASTDGKLDNLILSQDFSKNLASFEGETTLSGHVGGAYDVGNEKVSVVAGLMAKTRVSKDATAWVAADVAMQDVGGVNDVAGMVSVGVNGDRDKSRNAENASLDFKSDRPNEYARSMLLADGHTANGRQDAQENTPAISIPTATVKPEAEPAKKEEGTIASMSSEYYALEGHAKQQQAYLNNAAKTFSQNSGMDIRAAREVVLNLFEYEQNAQQNHRAVDLERS